MQEGWRQAEPVWGPRPQELQRKAEGLMVRCPSVEVEAAPFAGEVCLGAEGSNKVVEGSELLELQVGQLVDEERVGEVVVDGLIEAELREGRAEQGVVGAGRLEVVDALEGLVGLAGAREGVVRDDVRGAGHGNEGRGPRVAAAAGAGREAVEFEGLENVGEKVRSVGGRVEARVYDAGRAGSSGG